MADKSTSLPPYLYKIWQSFFAEQKLKTIVEYIASNHVKSLLELGCGPGNNRPFFEVSTYVGIDIDPKAIAIAQATFQDEFILGDITDMNFDNIRCFDMVLLHSVFHHLNDNSVRKVLSKLSQVVSPTGSIHIIDGIKPDKLSLSKILAILDRGHFFRTWNEWNMLFSEVLIYPPPNYFSLRLFGVHAYSMFHIIVKPQNKC
jgi:SAM-dependent methyltransferase